MSYEPDDQWRQRLREVLEASGRTRVDVARAAGLNIAFFTQVLNTGRTPRIDNLQKVAKELGTTVAWLVDGEGESPL